MKDKRWYPVLYMFIITAVFSTALIGFSQYTQNRVEVNQQLSFEIAVLKVLPGMYNPELSSIELHNKFIDQVNEPTEQTNGAYTIKSVDIIKAYALPIEGQGFWDQIKAVVGIDSDKKTITGFVVYQQRETPGLGAEIAKHEFTKQFENLKIAATGKAITFKRPGQELEQGQVHAVTGATQTSTRLERIINETLERWLKGDMNE